MGIIEIFGALAGLCYVIFSIRRNILLWPVGFISSGIYFIVFFNSKLYATMVLQLYYMGISIYGWYYWKFGDKTNQREDNKIVTRNIKVNTLIICIISALVLECPVFLILRNLTDSPYPVFDSVTTTLSIIATWMLARKYKENWLIWIFADTLSASLYLYMKLYATTILFITYVILAFIGYFEWKKELYSEKNI